MSIGRKIKFGIAIASAVVSFSIFELASMAGPHQLDYLGINFLCNAILVILAII